MTEPEARRRPRPSDRMAAAERAIDLPAAIRALRAEGKASGNGHRQITLMHNGPVRLVLFAFDKGGRLPDHQAPGWVTIHVLHGRLTVRTPDEQHELREGHILTLSPDVSHGVEADAEADMLLGIYPRGLPGSGAAATMP
jgi:quercetin dioxygenase-like cupin family protein